MKSACGNRYFPVRTSIRENYVWILLTFISGLFTYFMPTDSSSDYSVSPRKKYKMVFLWYLCLKSLPCCDLYYPLHLLQPDWRHVNEAFWETSRFLGERISSQCNTGFYKTLCNAHACPYGPSLFLNVTSLINVSPCHSLPTIPPGDIWPWLALSSCLFNLI